MKISEWPENERPRERLLARGPQALSNRLAVDGLTAARELVDALAARLQADTTDTE